MDFLCHLCPRDCGALRGDKRSGGFCNSFGLPGIARAAAHFGEEPCISGSRGTGAIFFTGCNLRCVFCQNYEISRGHGGQVVSPSQLRDIMLRLQDDGLHSIDLVTGSQYIPAIAQALRDAGLSIPVVWNSSGYESIEGLRLLEGLVTVYMPDFKYWSSTLAEKYSAAPDYPEVAKAAIKEMYRQRGAYKLDGDGILRSGLLVRHLILPGQDMNAMDVIDFVAEEFPRDSVLFSLMSQYTPMPGLEDFPELQQRVDGELNQRLIHYMHVRHLETGYWQETAAATDEMIPAFDGTGI